MKRSLKLVPINKTEYRHLFFLSTIERRRFNVQDGPNRVILQVTG